MSATKNTILTNKEIFLREYQKVKKRGYREEDTIRMTSEHRGNFYITPETLHATFDPNSRICDKIVIIAFCKAFNIPVDDKAEEVKFERKDKFLTLYDRALNQAHKGTTILDKLNAYCYIPKATFEDAVNRRKLNFNATIALALCKTFGFDIDEIYRDESSSKQTSPLLSVQDDMGNVDLELPHGFDGTFYGYFFSSDPDYVRQGKLDQFILDINSCKITMLLRHYALNMAKAYQPREIMMHGKIIYNQGGKMPSGILVIAFNSEDGANFCTLAYNKFHLNGKLYYRKGAMLTQSRDMVSMPVIQSFVFTHKKLDLDIQANRRILQGALALTNDTIRLKKGDLDTFFDSETMCKYFQEAPYKHAEQEYIELDERRLRSLNVCGEDDEDELYRILLHMKSVAVTPRVFRFPNNNADRTWRYIASLCEVDSLRQEEELSPEEQAE